MNGSGKHANDPAEFASVQLNEDEAAAQAAIGRGDGQWRAARTAVLDAGGTGALAMWTKEGGAEHIARHDPARALREVESGRRILERHRDCWCGNGPGDVCPEMADLLCRWADRPGYKPEWAPA